MKLFCPNCDDDDDNDDDDNDDDDNDETTGIKISIRKLGKLII